VEIQDAMTLVPLEQISLLLVLAEFASYRVGRSMVFSTILYSFLKFFLTRVATNSL
jgi:hypothetical protein